MSIAIHTIDCFLEEFIAVCKHNQKSRDLLSDGEQANETACCVLLLNYCG